MKVQDLLEILKKADPNIPVVLEHSNNDGGETCGWGASTSEYDIARAVDLETRIVLTRGY